MLPFLFQDTTHNKKKHTIHNSGHTPESMKRYSIGHYREDMHSSMLKMGAFVSGVEDGVVKEITH